MVDFFITQWNKNKDVLREYIKNNNMENFDEYEKLVKLVLELVINKDNDVYGETINVEKLIEINFGEYQGCLIYVFPNDTHQPMASETFYTTVDYGSCSGCDTLLSIIGYDTDEKPNKNQVEDLMELCLHLVQNTHRFWDWE